MMIAPLMLTMRKAIPKTTLRNRTPTNHQHFYYSPKYHIYSFFLNLNDIRQDKPCLLSFKIGFPRYLKYNLSVLVL
uniref:SD09393p n=1 Tax=Drosophila melanogaster TaxID=7227 RepID=Q6NP85_DROME|nr:SD09393p [Drosophila melanogaster]